AALALTPDGRRLFVSTYKGEQALHERGVDPIEVLGHPSRIKGLAMTPDGRTLAIEGASWSLQPLDGRPRRVLRDAIAVEPGHRDAELIVQFEERAVVLDAITGVEKASVPTPNRVFSPTRAGPGSLLVVDSELVTREGA